MTLLQRISRNVKSFILLFPRSGSRQRGVNILCVGVLMFTVIIYLTERMPASEGDLAEHQIFQKRDLAALNAIVNKAPGIEFVQKQPVAKSSKKRESMVATRIATPAATKKSTKSSPSSTSRAKSKSPEELLQLGSKNVENCPQESPELVGDMKSNPNITPSMEEVIKHVGPYVRVGGCFAPTICKAIQKVAVIIPFKDRDAHLKTLLYYLHPMLMRQRLHYCIYVVEQFDNGQFNKANIMNAGFEEALKLDDYDCVVFHDVDMIPENDKNFYMCGKNPRHLSPAIDKFDYKAHYGTEFGGVTGITPAQYRKANGHSNRFWGWGGEDNDMEFRIQFKNMSIVPSAMDVGRYMMIPHLHPWKFKPNKFPWRLNNTRFTRAAVDGLSDLQYQMVETLRYPLYTKIVIDIRKIKVTKLTMYINGKPAMDVDLYPGPCRYEEFPGKYLDYVIELTDKKEAQDLPLWPGLNQVGKSNLLKDNLVAANGRKRRFAMLHDLKQAQELCEKLQPECQGVQQENNQENYSLRKGGIPRHLVMAAGPRRSSANKPANGQDSKMSQSTKKRFILPDKNAYLRYCPGEFSYFKAHRKPLYCVEGTPCYHSYGFKVHFTVMLKPLSYLFYEDDKHFESRLEKGSNHHTFTWPNRTIPDPSKSKTPRSFTFRTPDFAIPNTPGTYAVESKIADKLQNPYFQWNWWFEVTTGNREDDARIREAYWMKKIRENVLKTKQRQHEAAMQAKAVRAKQNQIQLQRKVAELSKNRKKGLPPAIKQLVGKIQEHYDKREPGAVADELDANDPSLQRVVGSIEVSDGEDDISNKRDSLLQQPGEQR